MKSALALMLIVCLAAPAVPVIAQEKTETAVSFDIRGPATQATAGPLARAIAREAVRLAPTTSVVETDQQSGRPAASNWSRVRTLASGTEIIVTVQGAPPDRRYFVAAGESEVTILNLTDSTLRRTVTRALLDIASNHPEYFLAAQKGETFENDDVRVAGDGVFVAGRKIADVGQIVESIARTDVVEIKKRIGVVQRHNQMSGDWHVLVGRVSGGMVGAMLVGGPIGAADCSVGNCDERRIVTGALVGGVAGVVIGGILGYRWHRASGHRTEDVIYRAP